MPTTRIAQAAWALAGLYWLLLLLATHLPLPPAKNSRPPNGRDDKVQHCVAYAGLAFALCVAGALDGRFRRSLVPYVLLAIFGYSIADEWTQQFIRYRETDWNDWVADMLGTGTGLAAFLVFGEPVLAMLPRSRIPPDDPQPQANAAEAG
jgi:VanZ family protein